jgi:hypothetical protein
VFRGSVLASVVLMSVCAAANAGEISYSVNGGTVQSGDASEQVTATVENAASGAGPLNLVTPSAGISGQVLPEQSDAAGMEATAQASGAVLDAAHITPDGIHADALPSAPEPGSYLLLGVGLAVVGVVRRRAAKPQRAN